MSATANPARPAGRIRAPRSTAGGDPGSVLYDALGPRGRRKVRLGTAVAVVAGLGVAGEVVRRLAASDQFAAEKWTPLLDPRNELFGPLWSFLGGGLVGTLQAAGLAVVISLVVGTAMVCLRVTAAPWYRWAVAGTIELLRGTPVVLAMFFAARALPDLGVDLPTLAYVVIGLVAYNSVVIAEVLRSGIEALPRGQREAALAIGLGRWRTLRLILLPQAFRIMLPALISQLVVVVKDTSLGFILSYSELLRRANVAIQSTHNPIQVLFVVALIYITINVCLGKLAEVVERRLATRR